MIPLRKHWDNLPHLVFTMGLPWYLNWYRIHPQCSRPRFNSWVGKISWRRDRLSTAVLLGFPGGLDGKESACNAGDPGLIPGSGRSPGEGIGCPLQYCGPENAMDCIVHGVTKSQAWLSHFHFHVRIFKKKCGNISSTFVRLMNE